MTFLFPFNLSERKATLAQSSIAFQSLPGMLLRNYDEAVEGLPNFMRDRLQNRLSTLATYKDQSQIYGNLVCHTAVELLLLEYVVDCKKINLDFLLGDEGQKNYSALRELILEHSKALEKDHHKEKRC